MTVEQGGAGPPELLAAKGWGASPKVAWWSGLGTYSGSAICFHDSGMRERTPPHPLHVGNVP